MPRITVTLPDIEDSVSRPVIHTVVNDLFKIMDLRENPTIIYGGKRNIVHTPNAAITDNGDKNPRMEKDNLCFVQVKESYDKNQINYVHNNNYVERQLFCDPKLNVRLMPYYFMTDVEMSITYRSPSETDIRRCCSHLFSNASKGRSTNLHRVVYTYPLSYEFLVILEHIYKLREQVAGYGDDFNTYLNNHVRDQLSLAMTQSGTNRHLVVVEPATRIEGEFDFIGDPDEPSYSKEHGVWEISFLYRFQYRRVEGVQIEYPVSVHNQMIDSRLLTFLESTVDPEQRAKGLNNDLGVLEKFGMDYIRESRNTPSYIQIPSMDDFQFYQGVPYNTSTVMVALVSVDTDKRTLLDLHELGDFVIDPDILAFIATERLYVTKLYRSLINISLYVNEVLMPPEKLELTADLKVVATEDLDLRNQHRIRISVSPLISGVEYNALSRIRKYPAAFVKVISTMNELIARDPDFNLIAKQPDVSEWQFTTIYNFLKGIEHGLVGSTGRDSTTYFTSPSFSTRIPKTKLLSTMSLETIQRYLNAKRGNIYRTMTAYVFAKARKT